MPRPRVLVVTGLGLALAVLAYAVLAPSALPRLVDQRRDNATLEADLTAQQEQNAQRERELVLLKEPGEPGKKATERAAREELGFVHKEEVVFVGLPVGPSEAATASSASPSDGSGKNPGKQEAP